MPVTTIIAAVALVLVGTLGAPTVRAASAKPVTHAASAEPTGDGMPRKRDLNLLASGLQSAERRGWKRVKAVEHLIKDPFARKLLRWSRLAGRGGPATFDELRAFLVQSADWPGQWTMRRKAETWLAGKGTDKQVAAWFAKFPPRTGVGQVRLAETLERRGERAKAKVLLRKAWIEGDFSRADEKLFLHRHGRLLRRADHAARLDRLIWEGRYWPARRVLWRVSKDLRKLAQARLALRRERGNVDRLISLVPKHLRKDPGLIYERLRWRRRKGLDTAFDLIRHLGPDQPYPEKWWTEREILARRALRKGFITDAYRIARNHGLDDGAGFAEGEWLAGWIALRFLDEPKNALAHFRHMYGRVSYPISRARGAYWTARAYEALGRADKATEWHRRAAAHKTTYYGQLSAARVKPGTVLRFADPPTTPPGLRAAFRRSDLTRAYRTLVAAGNDDYLRAFFDKLLDQKRDDPAWANLAAEMARRTRRPDLGVHAAKVSALDGTVLAAAAFPTVHLPTIPAKWDLPQLESPLVMGMIRQESAFRTDAVSHANARGLMQLMPATAARVAKSFKLPYSRTRLITDRTYNLTLGQTYLANLMKDFDNSYVLSLAAYNAGPHRVRRWIKEYGDPREDNIDVIDWVEMIPFTETRNYVQRVMENLQVYRSVLGRTEIALAPHEDLNR